MAEVLAEEHVSRVLRWKSRVMGNMSPSNRCGRNEGQASKPTIVPSQCAPKLTVASAATKQRFFEKEASPPHTYAIALPLLLFLLSPSKTSNSEANGHRHPSLVTLQARAPNKGSHLAASRSLWHVYRHRRTTTASLWLASIDSDQLLSTGALAG